MTGPGRDGGVLPADGFSSVVFDCDSTLVKVEGVDLLAGERRGEIEALTEAAMRGEVALEDVYGRRLEILRPTREEVRAVGEAYLDTLVPDAREVVAELEGAGVSVWIVSGGLLPAVEMVARALGVPGHRVAAVDVEFDSVGRYAGFDPLQPLARSGGKPAVLESWGERLATPSLMVGDGMTDLEAGEVTDAFLAFAGVVDRPAVTGAAPLVVRSASLAPVFALAMGEREPDSAAGRALYRRGLELGWEDRRG